MKHLLPAAVATLTAASVAAGGIDQSRQPVDLLFKDGNYAQIGFGYWMPDVRGTDAFGGASGNVYGDISDLSFGVKRQITDRWSAALLVDQPWGVAVDYPGTSFPYAGTSARVKSASITGLVRYRFDDRFSLHAGLRATEIDGTVALDGIAFGNIGYRWQGDATWGLGYVVGGAYEVPAIALRVALTYSSETRHALPASETLAGLPNPLHSTTDVTMPQSVNLDLQTGITPRTLLYGSVRWVNWKDWSVAPQGFQAIGGDLVRFDSNALTYRLGVGRQFTDTFAGALEVSYETPKDTNMTPLAPYDGYTAISVGGTYTLASRVDLSAGLAYDLLGDADVEANGVISRFDHNHAVAAAFRIGYRF